MVRLSLLLFVFVCGCCLMCVCCVRGVLCDVVGVCCCAIVLCFYCLLLRVLCLSVYVCFVCGLSCGIVCFAGWCKFTVVVWFVCALVRDGVWCVCARVFSCVLFVRFVLLCSNMCVLCLECIV